MAGIKITFPSLNIAFPHLSKSTSNNSAASHAQMQEWELVGEATDNIPQAQPGATAPWQEGLQVFEILR